MLKTLITAFALLCLFTINSEARQRTYAAHPDCNILWPCQDVAPSPRGERVRKAMGGLGSARKVYTPRSDARVRTGHRSGSIAAPPLLQRMTGIAPAIVAPLAAKVAEIQSACGSRVVSGVRHTNIAGTHRLSLHASGKAVDLQGNPGCIYGHLAGWAGGYSTDYARMRHVHLSYDPDGGREMGLRFVHGGHRHARRYARHRHQRLAGAS